MTSQIITLSAKASDENLFIMKRADLRGFEVDIKLAFTSCTTIDDGQLSSGFYLNFNRFTFQPLTIVFGLFSSSTTCNEVYSLLTINSHPKCLHVLSSEAHCSKCARQLFVYYSDHKPSQWKL